MKIIKPYTEFYGEVPTDYDSAIKFIEVAGRTCYKSEDRITGDSAEKFVKKLINAKPYPHLAMVEHSNFVVRCNVADLSMRGVSRLREFVGKYINCVIDYPYVYIGGNLTAWYQTYKSVERIHFLSNSIYAPFVEIFGELFGIKEKVPGDIFEVCPQREIPKELQRYSVKFVCDRGVSHELVRHRPCSYAQESTRYVNYKDKDMEFIEPWWWEEKQSDYLKKLFEKSCEDAEMNYKDFIAFGRTPQAARAVLTNALKTEIIVTTDLAEWKHIFNLRCAKGVQPDFLRLSVPLRDDFVKEGLM